ncbi:hypothetical protein ORF090L [Spotted knifejaw iridovirus]|nr:hypothetical protein ORF090L [Spotted knifejaw iridovirus]
MTGARALCERVCEQAVEIAYTVHFSYLITVHHVLYKAIHISYTIIEFAISSTAMAHSTAEPWPNGFYSQAPGHHLSNIWIAAGGAAARPSSGRRMGRRLCRCHLIDTAQHMGLCSPSQLPHARVMCTNVLLYTSTISST